MVLGSPSRVFDLLAEDQGELKQEEVSVPSLSDQRAWIPNLEAVLQDQFTLYLKVFLKSWEEEEDSVSRATQSKNTVSRQVG